MKYFLMLLMIIVMFSGCSHKGGTENSQSGEMPTKDRLVETEEEDPAGEDNLDEASASMEQESSSDEQTIGKQESFADEQTDKGQELSPEEKITEEDKYATDNSNTGKDVTSDQTGSSTNTALAGNSVTGESGTVSPEREAQEQPNSDEKRKAGQRSFGEKTSSTGKEASKEKEASGKDSAKQEDSSKQEDTSSIKITQNDIFAEIDEIDAILSKSKEGTGNFLAELTGTAEQLDTIHEQSEEAMQNEDAVKAVIEKCEDDKKLVQYYDNITEYRQDLQSIKEEIKSARKEQEVEVLKQKLTELSGIIEEYNDYLLEV